MVVKIYAMIHLFPYRKKSCTIVSFYILEMYSDAMYRSSTYQILGIPLIFGSDTIACTDLFDQDYQQFRTDSEQVKGQSLSISVRLKTVHPHILVNDRIYPIDGHPNPASYAYQIIQWELFQRSGQFILVHAGVVEKNNRVVIIAGPPGSGKSTLTLTLLESGYRFYSDEICPICKDTGLVHPFPRTAWAHPQNFDLAAFRRIEKNEYRNGKEPVPLCHFPVGREPLKPSVLICLDPGGRMADVWVEIRLAFKPGEDHDFVTEANRLKHKLPNPDDLMVEDLGSGYAEWKIIYLSKKEVVAAVNCLIECFSARIWNLYRVSRVFPDFDRLPVLEKIAAHEASKFLIGDLKLGSPLLPIHQRLPSDTPGRLFMDLTEAVADADCHKLTVGHLTSMIHVIEDVAAV